MNFKKSVPFILLLVVIFSLCKNLFVSYAAENSGYVVLLNNENTSVSFAGMNYAIDSDLKSVSVEFQMTDTHLFKGKQGVEISVINGDKSNTIQINSESDDVIKAEFFSLNDVLIEINPFITHTNVKINFILNFEEKLKEKLAFKMKFADAEGSQSKEVYHVLYIPDESTDKTTNPKESSTTRRSTEDSDNFIITETSRMDSTENHKEFHYLDNDKVKNTVSSATQMSSELESVSNTDVFSDKNDAFGLRQIVAIIFAALLVVAAAVYIIIGIKRNKVT